MTANKWIDTHVHLFPEPAEGWPTLAEHGDRPCTPRHYLGILDGSAPQGIVVVHFSKAADSQHVIGALDTLKGKRPAVGVVKAADLAVFDWILRDDVKGVRIYAKESVPEFTDVQRWNRLWNLVRSKNKHILIFGDPEKLRKTIPQLPQDIPLVIDHLGLPDAAHGANDAQWNALLSEMQTRNKNSAPVYFKGPGYRSSLRVEEVQPFVNAIVRKLGVERLMLGATDAPFAGMPKGDLHWIRDYTYKLAVGAATGLGLDEEDTVDALLYGNAAELYGF